MTRDITGFNLKSIPESINEKMSFCRNVTGVIGSTNEIRRYVSLLLATVSDQNIVYYNGVYMVPNITTVFKKAEVWSLWNKMISWNMLILVNGTEIKKVAATMISYLT